MPVVRLGDSHTVYDHLGLLVCLHTECVVFGQNTVFVSFICAHVAYYSDIELV